MKLLRLAVPFLALAIVAAACTPHDQQPADTSAVLLPSAGAISPDSAAKLDSAGNQRGDHQQQAQHRDTLKPTGKRHHNISPTANLLRKIPLAFVNVAEAQTTTASAPAESGHRKFHWPYLLLLALVAGAAYAWYRKRQKPLSAGG
jgi:hypothetical protein